jgi:hypothetical protein
MVRLVLIFFPLTLEMNHSPPDRTAVDRACDKCEASHRAPSRVRGGRGAYFKSSGENPEWAGPRSPVLSGAISERCGGRSCCKKGCASKPGTTQHHFRRRARQIVARLARAESKRSRKAAEAARRQFGVDSGSPGPVAPNDCLDESRLRIRAFQRTSNPAWRGQPSSLASP